MMPGNLIPPKGGSSTAPKNRTPAVPADLVARVWADFAARRGNRPFCDLCGDRLVTPAAGQTHCEACLPEAAARGEQQPMPPTDLITHLQTHINAARKAGANVAELPLADLETVVARVRSLEFALRLSEATARAAVDQYEVLLVKLGATEAERDALKAATDDWRHKPAYKGEPTGVSLIDRLHGIYTVPVNDGAGPLNGSMTFTQRYEVGRINHEAADLLREVAEIAEELYVEGVAMVSYEPRWDKAVTRWLAVRGKVMGKEANRGERT